MFGVTAITAPVILRGTIANAASSKVIKIGHVSSQTGVLSPVSEAEPFILDQVRIALAKAGASLADVVRTMYDLGGGSAIYDRAPLQRRFRDAFTATAHFQVNEASRELPGRILLGQPAEVAML